MNATADQQHQRVRQDVGGVDAVGEAGVLRDEQRPGLDAVDGHGAEHDGGDGVAGNAERHDGHQRAADVGVVGGLRGDDALGVAVAELLRRLGELLGLVVGHHARRAAADRRQDADDEADDGRPQRAGTAGRRISQIHLEMREPLELGVLASAARLCSSGRIQLLDVGHDLREGEDADQHGQEREAAADELRAEGEARHAADRVGADDGDEEADGGRDAGP